MASAQIEINQRMTGLRKTKAKVNELQELVKDQHYQVEAARNRGDDSFEQEEELAKLEEDLQQQKIKLNNATAKIKKLLAEANLGKTIYEKNLDRLRVLEVKDDDDCPPRRTERPAAAKQSSLRPLSANLVSKTTRPPLPAVSQLPTKKTQTAKPTFSKPTSASTKNSSRSQSAGTSARMATGLRPPQVHLQIPTIRKSSENIPARTIQPQRPFISRMPQIKQQIPMIEKAIQVEQQIERHKNKQLQSQKIAKFGNFQNLRQHAQLKDQPKVIPQEQVKERIKGYKATVKNAKAVGVMKRQAAGPIAQSEFGTSADVRAKEAGEIKIKMALNAQRRIATQAVMKRAEAVVMPDADPLIARLNIEVDEDMPVKERMEAEHREVYEVKTLMMKKVCVMYSEYKQNEAQMDSETRTKAFNKLKKDIKEEIEKIFDLIRVYMAAYRGPSFRQDDLIRNKVVQGVLQFITRNPKPVECIDAIKKIWRQNPFPKFKLEPKSTPREEPMNPLETLKRPPSIAKFRSRLQRPTSTKTGVAAVKDVNAALKTLENFKSQGTSSSTREKLEKFTKNFCKIFSATHKTNRMAGYNTWRSPFFANLESILDELEEFYETLPHLDASKFDRKKIADQFNNFLFAIFEVTKSRDITPSECSKIVGDKIRTSAEVGRMKNLQKILNIFRTRVHEVIDPHVSLLEKENFTPSSSKNVPERTPTQVNAPEKASTQVKPTTRFSPQKAIRGTKKLTEEASNGMFKIINLWGSIRSLFCKFVTSGNGLPLLEYEIANLYEEFKDVLFEGNEVAELLEDFHGIDNCCMNLADCERISKQDCDALLDGNADVDSENSNRSLVWSSQLINELTRTYEKYMLKIVNGQAKPKKKKTATPQKFLDSSDEEFEKSIKDPSVHVTKMRTSVRVSPSKAAKIISPRISVSNRSRVAREPQSIDPVIYLQGMEVPDDVIERDILFVGLQLTDRQEEDLPVAKSSLVRDVLRVADHFKHFGMTEAEALATIGSIFWRLPCVAHDFINTFTYHPFNQFFESLKINEVNENAMMRANILREREVKKCDIEQSQNKTMLEDDLSAFTELDSIEESIEEVVEKLEKSSRGERESLGKLNGDVSICTNEIDNDDVLAVPTLIAGGIKHGIVTSDETKSFLKSIGEISLEPLANEIFEEEIKELDGRMKKQLEEDKIHLSNSKIYGQGIRYELKQNALDRQTFFQSCGQDLPKWFPGFFTVFPDSSNYKPAQVISPDSVFLHAWRTMAPVIEQN